MNRKEGKEQKKSEAGKEKEDPEEDIRTLRLWAGRARVFHEQAEERERLLAAGENDYGMEEIALEAAAFRVREQTARRELYERLRVCPLPPLQRDVLCRHYLRYQSRTRMAEETGYSRRYLLTLHARAIQRLANRETREGREEKPERLEEKDG